ncbi:hypothetical protein XENOCAPTIV_016291 [Xenoophorus captivus]|uniref:Uncharacterized protein n=1 Tax=Xenoophorus captivus TaxID=1517983 RepID=A0ABV0QJU4_9TELE
MASDVEELIFIRYGLPESLRGQPVALLHGLTELLPGLSFCLCHSPGCGTLGLTVPVSRLRSPTGKPQSLGLIQLDSIPYCQCPPPGSGIATATGTTDLTATATGSSINNRYVEHGPFRLYASNIPRNLVKALPEVGVEYIPGRGPDVPSRPSPCAWACQVCPAFSSSIGSNSPPGGDQWTANRVHVHPIFLYLL